MKKIYIISFIFLLANSLFCLAQNSLVGMTYGGGANSCGTIFKMNLDGSGFQTIYSFDTITGMHPYGSLLQANDGKLYGMTNGGGDSTGGVLFRFDPVSYAYKVLFNFNNLDGVNPYGSLIQATDGKLYGMTALGGVNDDGVLFSFNIVDSSYTKLLDFSDSIGYTPKGNLLQATDGKLYGMTAGGGANYYGVLFNFDPIADIYSKLIDFEVTNGSSPYGSLIEADNNILYGTTRFGGAHSAGVIFNYNPSNRSYSKLLDFAGGNNEYPCSGLLLATNGKFYGMTGQGGLDGVGSVYSYDTTGSIYNDVQDFDTVNGSSPSFNTLMQASNNTIYGMTLYGGENNEGVVFSFNPADSLYAKLVDFNDTNGKYPGGTLIELQSATGIITQAESAPLLIYPNPAEKELKIRNAELRIKKLDIYNVLGMKIYSCEPQTSDGKSETVIDVSALSPGIYLIKVADGSGSLQSVGRFVKE